MLKDINLIAPSVFSFLRGAAGAAAVALSVLIAACPALAAPSVQVNGSAGPVTVPPGATIAAAVANGPGNPGDWVGIYAVGSVAGPNNLGSWKWLSTDKKDGPVPPPPGVAAGVVHLSVPTQPGKYDVRFFSNNSFNVAASSAPVTATASRPTPSPYQTKEISWTPGADIAGVGIGVFPRAATVVSISCRVESVVGKPAVFTVAMAPNGTALKSGIQISPTMCDGNAKQANNQPIFVGALAVPSGAVIGIVADDPLLPAGNLANWLSGAGMGIVTVEYTVP